MYPPAADDLPQLGADRSARSTVRVHVRVDESSVERLLARDSQERSAYLHLIASDANFRELCEEYEVCHDAFAGLAYAGYDQSLREEYGGLLLQLQGQLVRYLLDRESQAS
jgi:hypothetical protein